MKGFLSEILTALDLEMGQLAGGYKYSVFGNQAVVVEGHNGVNSLDGEKIALKLKRKRLVVSGKRLIIKQLDGKCAIITGEIDGVTVE